MPLWDTSEVLVAWELIHLPQVAEMDRKAETELLHKRIEIWGEGSVRSLFVPGEKLEHTYTRLNNAVTKGSADSNILSIGVEGREDKSSDAVLKMVPSADLSTAISFFRSEVIGELVRERLYNAVRTRHCRYPYHVDCVSFVCRIMVPSNVLFRGQILWTQQGSLVIFLSPSPSAISAANPSLSVFA
jgi:hypothetical protein